MGRNRVGQVADAGTRLYDSPQPLRRTGLAAPRPDSPRASRALAWGRLARSAASTRHRSAPPRAGGSLPHSLAGLRVALSSIRS